MSEHHSAEEIKKSVRKYIMVFVALLVGTVVTVLANEIHFSSIAMTVFVALLIASVKAFLVAGYFMHLISEKKMIYAILAATAFFFVALMYLTIWSLDKGSLIHIKHVT